VTLTQTIDLKSDIVDARKMLTALERACQIYGMDMVQVRLGQKTDSWGQTHYHMKICCYSQERK
jgi:hypothetical protein